MIQLKELELSDQQAFEKALQEAWEPHFTFAHYFESLAGNDFEKYVGILPKVAEGLLIPSDYVPSTILFAFNETGDLVGQVSIRHQLNESLTKIGGHVGYGVAPSHRKKGYASEILRQAIVHIIANHPALKEILLTCDENNLGSIKTIEKNGGVFKNTYKTAEMLVAKRHYWIKIA